MFAIVGAAGNVGYSTSMALRKAGVPVRAILRDAAKAAALKELGCEIALADLQDSEALAKAIAGADAVQIIVPVALKVTDPAEELRQSIDSIARALGQVSPQRVLAISDYGAHVTDDIGMPTIFHGLEGRLSQLNVPRTILRSAEHMHNWARVIPVAMASGNLPTFYYLVDMVFPTIAAADLGLIAADLLLRPSEKDLHVVHAEGPRRYSANDVATALTELSGRTIRARVVPRSQWKETFERNLPGSLAELLIKANEAHNRGGLIDVEPNAGEVRYGTTELMDALQPFLR